MATNLTIGRLARDAGVNVETVRYYQRRGLLPEPPRGAGAIRHYRDEDADRLRFIKRAQSMGFSLTEVESLLQVKQRCSCRETQALASQKLLAIDERIRELKRFRRDLSRWIADCGANVDDATCPAIDALDDAASPMSRTNKRALVRSVDKQPAASD